MSKNIDEAKTCSVCGTALSGVNGSCPVCMLREGLAGRVESGDSSWSEETIKATPEQATRRFEHYALVTDEDGNPIVLGRGAMGVTYKAFDVDLRLPVTLKLISEKYIEDQTTRLRFLREARAAAKVRHSNVASVFHLGRTSQGYFYAMEFVEGETLESLILRLGRLKVKLALEIATQVTAGLGAVHKENLVHRDIKPSNIMVSSEEGGVRTAKIIDLGLAKTVGDSTSESVISMLGGFAGTPEFASPEQFAGIGVDIRSDLYSLGVTLWEMLTGKMPFRGSPAEVMSQQQGADLPLEQMEDVPQPVVSLLEVLLEKDPGRRLQSPAELLNALSKVTEAVKAGRIITHQSLRALEDQPLAASAKAIEMLRKIGNSFAGRRSRLILWPALVLLLSVVIWWFGYSQHRGITGISGEIKKISEEAHRITKEKIRAQLLESVERTRQAALADAQKANGWKERERLRQGAEKAYAGSISRIDELAVSFAEIEGTAKSSQVFDEMTRILAQEGVDQALAYAATQQPGIMEKVKDRAAAAREKNRGDLLPLLKSAQLQGDRNQSVQAESLFADILALEPDWPDARNAFAWFLIQQGMVVEPAKGKSKLEKAAEICQGTLAFTQRGQSPQEWAKTQKNLGTAFLELGTRSGAEEGRKLLQDAVAAYRSALEVYTRADLPQAWAQTQNNLGIALDDLGIRSSAEESGKLLQNAVAAYRSALEVRTRADLPQYWAATQNNLGNALEDLGARSDEKEGRRLFEDAAAAYRSALEVFTRTDVPQYWAGAEDNLGDALKELGIRSGAEECPKLLQNAVAAYHSALEVRTRADLPQAWAETQSNLGDALAVLADQLGGEEALKRKREAVDLLRDVDSYQQDEVSRCRLASALAGLAFNLILNDQFAEAQTRCIDAQKLVDEIGDGINKTDRDNLILVQKNLAHALLFQGHYGEALAIYGKNWDKPLKGKTFGEVTLEDFAAFNKADLTHPDLFRMKQELGNFSAKTSSPRN
jgi:serine/threonine protein kinase